VFALAILALGCSGKTSMPIAEGETSQRRGAERIVYVDLGSSENLVKRWHVVQP
jgi:hypothetical protein